MFDEELERGDRVVDDATADAHAEILAAPDRVAGADDASAHAAPPDEHAAAASGASIGHGPIRLRSQRPPRLDDADPGVVAPEAAALRGSVGHGTIRLLDRRAPDSSPREESEPVAPEVVGHGPIWLVERRLDVGTAATDAAVADIYAVLSAAT
jgi:hypothetical protein